MHLPLTDVVPKHVPKRGRRRYVNQGAKSAAKKGFWTAGMFAHLVIEFEWSKDGPEVILL